MKKSVVLLTLLLSLAVTAAAIDISRRWRGRHVNDMIAMLGPPTQVLPNDEDRDGHLYVWTIEHHPRYPYERRDTEIWMAWTDAHSIITRAAWTTKCCN
jgi:hypothetical protein